MKNKPKRMHTYQFPLNREIESCYSCPACEQHPDYGTVKCNILDETFELEDENSFPDNCPMDETNLPESFNRQ